MGKGEALKAAHAVRDDDLCQVGAGEGAGANDSQVGRQLDVLQRAVLEGIFADEGDAVVERDLLQVTFRFF